jgi:UPF0716 family protein affecting phage T7 exclusion
MLRRYGCLIVALWPFLELFILIVSASTWGWQPVVLIIALTGILGLAVMRLGIATTGRSLSEAMRLLQQRNESDYPGEHGQGPRELEVAATDLPPNITPPAQSILLIPAGVLIALPGFIGDAIGICMLIPAVRRYIARRWHDGINP